MTTITLPRPRVRQPAPGPAPAAPPSRLHRLAFGPEGDPRWVRPALVTLLVATAVLYLWGLGASGWANSFYSAAVQAGTKSWKAFFFGSSDAANFISVDKPPAALWVMELSARVFGVNAWSILVPQALEGVATVGLVYATVRRWFGAGAGLLGGAIVALTPVAALMFRFNNPDALLVLLLTAAAYATIRAIETGRTRWLLAAATLIGCGFLTKMLQAFLVVPALALAYLIAGPPRLPRRLLQLLAAAAALAVSSLWWVVAVMAVPAADRPYIGGSQNNSLWNLLFGYNGFGRLTGSESGSVGGGLATGSRWGPTGLLRMFNTDFGGQASWLLPAALILLAAGLALTWRAGRTDRARAALVIWGGWLVVTGLVFSLGQGIIHPYYTVALAPAIGGAVASGASVLWARRRALSARTTLAAALAVTGVWSYVLLNRTPSWHPVLRDAELIAALALAVLVVTWTHLRGRLSAAVAVGAVVVALIGPAAYTLSTVAATHSGAIPSAGPAVTGGIGGGPPGQAFTRPAGFTRPALGGGARGIGGLLSGSAPTAALTATLEAGSGHYTWVAAAVGSNEAAGYQLASSEPVMAIGGFNGTDPAPSLAQFERYVQAGRIHYFIAGGGGPGSTTSTVGTEITTWVESHFTATTVGGVTLYDLTPASS